MTPPFSRFVFAALLSVATGMTFAGDNYTPLIPEGANQVSVKTGSTIWQGVVAKENAKNAAGLKNVNGAYHQPYGEKAQSANVSKGQNASSVSDANGATGAGMRECADYDLVVGNENSRSKVFRGEGGDLFLIAKIPNTVRNIGGEDFSVGGEVRVPFRIVPEECLKGADARWNRDSGAMETSQENFDAMKCARADGIAQKIWCGSGMDATGVDEMLTHESVHVAFDKEYLKLDGDDDDVKAQYHFVSEMMAYMIGDGMSPEESARMAVKGAPDKLKEKIKALRDAFLKGQFRFRNPADILKEKGNAPTTMNDLKNMNLDDKNGDWCHCVPPGCEEQVSKEGFYVSFVCVKCNKVNVSFAKKAIAFEAKTKELGGDVKWYGPNAEQRAKSAAGNAK